MRFLKIALCAAGISGASSVPDSILHPGCAFWGKRDSFSVVLGHAPAPYVWVTLSYGLTKVRISSGLTGQPGDTLRRVIDIPAGLDSLGHIVTPRMVRFQTEDEAGQVYGSLSLCMLRKGDSLPDPIPPAPKDSIPTSLRKAARPPARGRN